MADEPQARYREKFPATISFHCTTKEAQEFRRVLSGRKTKKPGMNYRDLFVEMLAALQKEGYYR